MKRTSLHLCTILSVVSGCGVLDDGSSTLPIETSAAFTNLSRTMYAQFQIRATGSETGTNDFYKTTLLAPGATLRRRFRDALGDPCPEAIDLRVFLFMRINDDVPIGLDPGETVSETPTLAAEVRGVPACGSVVAETYTIVNWDAPAGTARVKIAQATPVEELIRQSGLFPNDDAVWEASGVDPNLADVPPSELERAEPIEGRTILADGTPVEGLGVLLRSRFRLRLSDDDASNDPDAGFGDPIAVATTNENGEFRFDRPPGAYQVEAFSDNFLFRPSEIIFENPSGEILIVAEPITP